MKQPIGKLRLVKNVKRSLTAVSHSGDPRHFWGEGWGEGAKPRPNAVSLRQTKVVISEKSRKLDLA